MDQSAAAAEAGAITADLVYSIDTGVKPVNETMEEGNLKRVYTGEFAGHEMTISNGRPDRDRFDLDVNGFEFVDHPTRMNDFFDADELTSVYYPEVEALIKERTGCNWVHIFDHTLRTGDREEQEAKLIREPVLRVHNDYTEWSGPQRVRDLMPDRAEELIKHRFAIVQVWRAINKPIESNPLAIADARSLREADLIPSERRYPNRVGETYQVQHSPDHRWYYFPKMTRDEAIVFKVYESETDGRARWTAHTSFDDPTTPEGAPPRQSIEMRSIAFWAPRE